MALPVEVQAAVRRCTVQLSSRGFSVRGRYALRAEPVGLLLWAETPPYMDENAVQINWRCSVGAGRHTAKQFDRQWTYFLQVQQRPQSERQYKGFYPVGTAEGMADFEHDFARFTLSIVDRATSAQQMVDDILSGATVAMDGSDGFCKARGISRIADTLDLAEQYSVLVRDLLTQYAAEGPEQMQEVAFWNTVCEPQWHVENIPAYRRPPLVHDFDPPDWWPTAAQLDAELGGPSADAP